MSTVEQRVIASHRATASESTGAIIGYLVELLGRALTAHLASADRTSIDRWQAGAAIRELDTEKKLRAAYQIATLLLPEENEHTVRAWFIGMNPQLNDEAPADAIREGRLNEALLAAKSFMLGG